MCVCVRACVRACMRACVRIEELARERDDAVQQAQDLDERLLQDGSRAQAALDDEVASRRAASETAAVLARSQKSLQVYVWRMCVCVFVCLCLCASVCMCVQYVCRWVCDRER